MVTWASWMRPLSFALLGGAVLLGVLAATGLVRARWAPWVAGHGALLGVLLLWFPNLADEVRGTVVGVQALVSKQPLWWITVQGDDASHVLTAGRDVYALCQEGQQVAKDAWSLTVRCGDRSATLPWGVAVASVAFMVLLAAAGFMAGAEDPPSDGADPSQLPSE